MSEPSPAYYEALRATQKLHANSKKFNGRFLSRYIDDIKPLIDELGCKTLLDHGCGGAKCWNNPMDDGQKLDQYLGVIPTLYDPGLPRYSREPQGKYDIVICTQVLGSIPIADLPWVVDRLYGFAGKALYVGERLDPVRKQVHAHMKGQMPHEWSPQQWADVLRRPGSDIKVVLRTRSEKHGPTLETL